MYLHVFIHHEYCNKKKFVRNERSATFWNNLKKKVNATELKVIHSPTSCLPSSLMSSKHRLVSVRMVRRRLEHVQKRLSSAGIFAIIVIGTKSPEVIQEIVHGTLPCKDLVSTPRRKPSYRSL